MHAIAKDICSETVGYDRGTLADSTSVQSQLLIGEKIAIVPIKTIHHVIIGSPPEKLMQSISTKIVQTNPKPVIAQKFCRHLLPVCMRSNAMHAQYRPRSIFWRFRGHQCDTVAGRPTAYHQRH